jgi:hypothetical protein
MEDTMTSRIRFLAVLAALVAVAAVLLGAARPAQANALPPVTCRELNTVTAITPPYSDSPAFGYVSLDAGDILKMAVKRTAGGITAWSGIQVDPGGVVDIPIPASVGQTTSGSYVIPAAGNYDVWFHIETIDMYATVKTSCTHPSSTTAAPTAVPTPPDDRLNWGVADYLVVLYPGTDAQGSPAIRVFGVGEDGEGIYLFTITQQDIAAFVDNPPAVNTPIMTFGDITLYALASGEFQLNIGPDAEGKTQVIIFDSLAPGHVYGYTIEP